MRAILLAGGLGTRLKPLTNKTPKCLMRIGGKPLLEIWLDNLSDSGVDSFLINTHYLHHQVEDFVNQSNFKNKITLAHETYLLGTAGTLIDNLSFLDDDEVILIHADNYCKESMGSFINAHKNRPKECLMTMMIFSSEKPTECGVVKLNSNNVVLEFYEKVKSPPSNLANGAVYILSRKMIDLIENDCGGVTDFSTQILPKFMGKIYTFETKKAFIDIGTIDNYHLANKVEYSYLEDIK
jgi:mannose-1-phosphate guanylyltransferase